MRAHLLLLSLCMVAAPAIAQPTPTASPARDLQIPRELTDPATADRLARAMDALSKSFMNLPVGELQAAVEGRAPTPAERKLTVRDLGRRQRPDFERQVNQQVANAKPMIEQSMKALAAALPAMMQGLEQAESAIERAVANMPDPTYPKR